MNESNTHKLSREDIEALKIKRDMGIAEYNTAREEERKKIEQEQIKENME